MGVADYKKKKKSKLPYMSLFKLEKIIKNHPYVNTSISVNLHSKATKLDRDILKMIHVICFKLS